MSKGMNDFKAIGIAEGFIEAETVEEVFLAWSHIVKENLWQTLQFGRTLNDLIEKGVMDADGNVNWEVLDLEEPKS